MPLLWVNLWISPSLFCCHVSNNVQTFSCFFLHILIHNPSYAIFNCRSSTVFKNLWRSRCMKPRQSQRPFITRYKEILKQHIPPHWPLPEPEVDYEHRIVSAECVMCPTLIFWNVSGKWAYVPAALMSQTCRQGTEMEGAERSGNKVRSTGCRFKTLSACNYCFYYAHGSCGVELHVRLFRVYTLTPGSWPVRPQSSTFGKGSPRINKSSVLDLRGDRHVVSSRVKDRRSQNKVMMSPRGTDRHGYMDL